MVPQTIPFRGRFNFMKADWNGYSAELDKLIEDVEPIPANYKCFVESVRVASRRHIPRGCRTEYVPGLTDESKSLYEAYKCKYSSSPFDDCTIESGNTLIEKSNQTVNPSRRQRMSITFLGRPYTSPKLISNIFNRQLTTSKLGNHSWSRTRQVSRI